MVLGTWYIFYGMDGWMDGWTDKWMNNVYIWVVWDFRYDTNPNWHLTVPSVSVPWPSFSLKNFTCWVETISTYSIVTGIENKQCSLRENWLTHVLVFIWIPYFLHLNWFIQFLLCSRFMNCWYICTSHVAVYLCVYRYIIGDTLHINTGKSSLIYSLQRVICWSII